MKRRDVRHLAERRVRTSRGVRPIRELLYSKGAEIAQGCYDEEKRGMETVHALVNRRSDAEEGRQRSAKVCKLLLVISKQQNHPLSKGNEYILEAGRMFSDTVQTHTDVHVIHVPTK